jgi:hypothetical protein
VPFTWPTAPIPKPPDTSAFLPHGASRKSNQTSKKVNAPQAVPPPPFPMANPMIQVKKNGDANPNQKTVQVTTFDESLYKQKVMAYIVQIFNNLGGSSVA